ncbi:hypothetical protein ACERII_05165 [Evansella sp. AB-rgal1]|uniref:hypothetical protein n=1 Tax=Evansella sp. AB-rgal1 TaxID=3242696 RepID=UPI00359F035C
MLSQYLWVKWGEILLSNLLLLSIFMLITFSIIQLTNITLSYSSILLVVLAYCVSTEVRDYKKWLRHKTF